MWAVAGFRSLPLINSNIANPTILVYNRLVYYTVKPAQLGYRHGFIYTSKYAILTSVYRIGFEHSTVQFKYNGKAYRVSRRNKMLHLNFHYPTYKYLVWNNITLKHRKKRKKLFKLMFNTFADIRSILYYNLQRIRPLNTYTRRGIYLSNFGFDQRKVKNPSRR